MRKTREVLRSWQTCGLTIDGPAAAAAVPRWIGGAPSCNNKGSASHGSRAMQPSGGSSVARRLALFQLHASFGVAKSGCESQL
ncbi:hypothetical protein ANN_14603 [Periplaneta americana]|uniref:Uncharacterized protein n=1 Tax=Periplaneta americana TaxID=6978 RepID=A0ABQ8SWT0_PERAM|nr:hypothetical protein ANN_14603 [Periplaneta americana]